MATQKEEIYQEKNTSNARQIILDFISKLSLKNIDTLIMSSDISSKKKAVSNLFNRQPYTHEDCTYMLVAIELYTFLYKDTPVPKYNASFFNISDRDYSELISTAKFFITNASTLMDMGWTPAVPRRNMARAYYLQEEKKIDRDILLQKVITLSVRNFTEWYKTLN